MHSIKQQLQQYLSVFLTGDAIAPERIGLYRLERAPGIAYRCAIALELAARGQQSAEAIARELYERLGKNADCAALTAPDIEGGWLKFQLRDRSLALWLQNCLERGGSVAIAEAILEREESVVIGEAMSGRRERESASDSFLFPVQYARARCCSLLRSGHRDKIIELEGLETSYPSWRWLHPQSIPWLTSDSENAILRLQHPAERQLIWRLCEVTDVLAGVSKGEPLKLALALSEALLECDRACRIWGEVKRDTPDLAIARLGLLAVTCRAIDGLLQEMGFKPLTTL